MNGERRSSTGSKLTTNVPIWGCVCSRSRAGECRTLRGDLTPGHGGCSQSNLFHLILALACVCLHRQ